MKSITVPCYGMAFAAEFRTWPWFPQMSTVNDQNGHLDMSFRLHGKVLQLFKHPFDPLCSISSLMSQGSKSPVNLELPHVPG